MNRILLDAKIKNKKILIDIERSSELLAYICAKNYAQSIRNNISKSRRLA